MLSKIEQPSLISGDLQSELSQLLPRKPLLSSQKLNWAGILLEYHCQPAGETPYASSPYHSIIVNHSHQIHMERWSDNYKLYKQFNKGDITIFPANTQHKQSWNREWEFCLLGIDPKLITQIAYESIGVESIEILPRFATPDPLIYQFCLGLISELRLGDSCCCLYVEHLVSALSIHLIRKYSVKNQSLRQDSHGLSQGKLQQAIAYINEHLTENLSLKDISNVVGMSPFYFTSLFKQSMGMTAYQYVIYHRIERAKQLLRQQELSIGDVSAQVGFESQSHFTNVFRKHTSKTPKMYQKDPK
jgi:AraC family transcriptional regulator